MEDPLDSDYAYHFSRQSISPCISPTTADNRKDTLSDVLNLPVLRLNCL